MYGMVQPGVPIRFGGLVHVSSPADLDLLIKEAEVLRSEKGRPFFARLHDSTLEFRIASSIGGYEVTAVASDSCASAPYFVGNGRPLLASIIGQSMAFGRLFTAAM